MSWARNTSIRRSYSVDRKSTRLNSSHDQISYAVFCLKKKKKRVTVTSTDISSLREYRSKFRGRALVLTKLHLICFPRRRRIAPRNITRQRLPSADRTRY